MLFEPGQDFLGGAIGIAIANWVNEESALRALAMLTG
jgi:hypothetical protein